MDTPPDKLYLEEEANDLIGISHFPKSGTYIELKLKKNISKWRNMSLWEAIYVDQNGVEILIYFDGASLRIKR